MRRRLVVLFGMVALLWALVPASLVSGYQVQGGAPTTGCVTEPHILWQGSVQGYQGFDIQYRLQMTGLGLVMIRPEFSNGQLGPQKWYRGDAAVDLNVWESFRIDTGGVPPSGSTYKTVAITPGSTGTLRWIATPIVNDVYPGCFRVSNVAVRSYLLVASGGATPPPGGGGMATPTPSPSPDPSVAPPTIDPETGFPPEGYCVAGFLPEPGAQGVEVFPCETVPPTPTPAPSAPPGCVDQMVTVETYRVFVVCARTQAFSGHYTWVPGSGWRDDNGTGLGWSDQFVPIAGETAAWGRVTYGAIACTDVAGSAGSLTLDVSPTNTDDGGYSNPQAIIAPGGCGDYDNSTVVHQRRGVVAGTSYRLQSYDALQGASALSIEMVGAEIWLGASHDGPAPWTTLAVPSASPSPSPSTSPSPSPSPTPPPGWATPSPATGVDDPNGDGWATQGYEGDNSDGAAAGGGMGAGNGSGVAECETGTGYTPVEDKPGYAVVPALTASPDLFTMIQGSGSVVPISWVMGGIRWAGESVSAAVGNASHVLLGVWNAGVDAVVPGGCVGAIVTRGTEDLMLLEPFATYAEVDASVRAAMLGAAGAAPAWCVPLPGGGEACLPLDDWAATVAPARAVSSVLVWVVALIGVLNVIQRSFKVAAAGVRAGDAAEIMDRRIY